MDAFEKQSDEAINRALEEDLGRGDATTDALVDGSVRGKADFLVKAEGVLAGIEVARRIFQKIDQNVDMRVLIPDGTPI